MYVGAIFFGIGTGEDLRKPTAENGSASKAIDRALEKLQKRLLALAYETIRVSIGLSKGYIP